MVRNIQHFLFDLIVKDERALGYRIFIPNGVRSGEVGYICLAVAVTSEVRCQGNYSEQDRNKQCQRSRKFFSFILVLEILYIFPIFHISSFRKQTNKAKI